MRGGETQAHRQNQLLRSVEAVGCPTAAIGGCPVEDARILGMYCVLRAARGGMRRIFAFGCRAALRAARVFGALTEKMISLGEKGNREKDISVM